MGEPQFTPGRWRLFAGAATESVRSFAVISPDDGYVATWGSFKSPEAEANAHLIATAPDLYEALASLVRSNNSGAPITDPIHPRLWANAEAALAKARGEKADV